MTEDLGTPSKPLTHYGAALNLQERTIDPTDTQERDAWLRVDLAPEDNQVATLRFDNGSGTWDVPLFATGTSAPGVEEVFRVRVNGQDAYIPVVDPADAQFPELAFRHAGSTLGVHNRVEPGSAIPDSDVYLHDDWGDGKLQSRDDSGTTTYNGVTGYYRPEWNQANGWTLPTVTSQQLDLFEGDGIDHEINLDLSETVVWEFTGVDVTAGTDNATALTALGLYAEQRSNYTDARPHSAYLVRVAKDSTFRLTEVASDGTANDIIDAAGQFSNAGDIKVTRTSSGGWELFADGTSVGTATDTSHTNPQYMTFTARDGTGTTDSLVDEIKVNGGSGNENGGSESVTLSNTSVDAQDSDGAQLIDMTGNGDLDIVVAGDNDGVVLWYEQDTPTSWTKHTISTGHQSIEGIDAMDVNGDGNVEVFYMDQDADEVGIAVQDSRDPTGSWSTTVLDSNAPNAIHSLVADVTGDGNENDLIYTYEGESSGEGGVYWLEWTGGGVGNSSNWTKHEIVQEEGAWGIARRRADLSGDNNETDVVFGARTARNSAATGGVWWAEPPIDPRDPWTQHTIDLDDSALHVDVGDISGDGNAVDVVAGRFDDGTGVYWYDHGDNWSRSLITNADGNPIYNVRTHGWRSGQWDVIVIHNHQTGASNGTMEYWTNNSGAFNLETTAGLYKAVDRIPIGDINNDGSDEFVTTTEAGSVDYWTVTVS